MNEEELIVAKMALEDYDRRHAQRASRLRPHECRRPTSSNSYHVLDGIEEFSELPILACYHLPQDEMHPNLHGEMSRDAGHGASWPYAARDRHSDLQTLNIGLGSGCIGGKIRAADGETVTSTRLSDSDDERAMVLLELRPVTCDSHLQSGDSRAPDEVSVQGCENSDENLQDWRQEIQRVRGNSKLIMVSRQLRHVPIIKHSSGDQLNSHGCPICQRSFDSSAGLRHHMNTHNAKGAPKHVCGHCSRGFRYPKDLRRHIVLHEKSDSQIWSRGPVRNFLRYGHDMWHICGRHTAHVNLEEGLHDRSQFLPISDSELPDSIRSRRFSIIALEVAAKAGMFSTSAACLHVVSNYGCSGSPGTSGGESSHCVWRLDNIQGLLWEPPWLAHPHPLLLLASSIGAGSLLITYHKPNVRDRAQDVFLWVSLAVSMAAGLFSGHSVLTTALATVPWALLFALALGDFYHAGLELRSRPRIHIPGDTEKQQCSESREGGLGQDDVN